MSGLRNRFLSVHRVAQVKIDPVVECVKIVWLEDSLTVFWQPTKILANDVTQDTIKMKKVNLYVKTVQQASGKTKLKRRPAKLVQRDGTKIDLQKLLVYNVRRGVLQMSQACLHALIVPRDGNNRVKHQLFALNATLDISVTCLRQQPVKNASRAHMQMSMACLSVKIVRKVVG